jgi:hypothetical protein
MAARYLWDRPTMARLSHRANLEQCALWRTHFCAMSYSFSDIAQFASKWGGPPGPQPTPSSACLVWIGLNSLATGGSRGTRADQGVCPTIPVQFPALENYMTLRTFACRVHNRVNVSVRYFRTSAGTSANAARMSVRHTHGLIDPMLTLSQCPPTFSRS